MAVPVNEAGAPSQTVNVAGAIEHVGTAATETFRCGEAST